MILTLNLSKKIGMMHYAYNLSSRDVVIIVRGVIVADLNVLKLRTNQVVTQL